MKIKNFILIIVYFAGLEAVFAQSVELKYPLGGEQFENGDTCNISWFVNDSIITELDILIWDCHTKAWDTIAADADAQTGYYDWAIPSNSEQFDFRLKLCYNGGTEYSISPGYFQIAIDEPIVSGINEIKKAGDIYLYPVPARNSLNIISNGPGIKGIKIYDFTMKQVFENSYHDIISTTIDITGLADGLYYIELTNNDNTKSIKNFVKF